MSEPIIWALIGIALLSIEAFALQGMGILFAGFAAISLGVSIFNNPEAFDGEIGKQFSYFFGYTIGWAALLWLPLKYFYGYASEDEYKNIIGTYGTVEENFGRDEIGKLRWSGTTVRAKIDDTSVATDLKAKSHVRVTAIKDGVYIVKPVREDMVNFKDKETLKREAEEKALREDAEKLSAPLGVKIGSIESLNLPPPVQDKEDPK